MATIKIIDGINGSFPAQNAPLILDMLTIRTSTGSQKSYLMKSAITSLTIVSEHGDETIFTIRLRDGSHFKGEADKRTVTYLMKFVGAESSAPYVVSAQVSNASEQRNMLVWVPFIVIASFITYQWMTRTEATAPAVASVQQQVPEDLAKQQQALREYEVRQEKGAKAAAAANALQGVKTSELLLEGAELDLKNGKLSDIDAYGIGAMLEVIYSMAHSLQEGWTNQEYLTPADLSHLKAAEAKLLSFQKRAFPKLRLAYKKQAATKLWEHDVKVVISGSDNTVLTFYSFWFAANTNIQSVQEQMYELTARLRFKRLRFATDEYSSGSQYKLDTPSDGVIAETIGYANGFHALDKKKTK